MLIRISVAATLCAALLAQEPREVATQPNPSPAMADAKSLGAAIDALALDLWGKLAATPGNLAFSPASIALAVALTAPGARGETQKQLLRFLHVDSADVLPGLAKLAQGWQADSRGGLRIALANRLFGARSCPFERAFLDLVARAFRAPLETLDFQANPERARLHVNAWIERETAQRIRDLLPPSSIDRDTMLLLVNAIHFLGDWAKPFVREATGPLPFHRADGTKVDVPTMFASDSIELLDVAGTTLVQLRYVGKDFAMLLALPPKDAPPAQWLTADLLAVPESLPAEKAMLYLPRFRVEAAETTRLKPIMQALGVELAFDRARADLTGIATLPSPERLVVQEVFHKAFVRVDEKGTEAAAATAVQIGKDMAAAPSKRPREVRFDRPFWFALRSLSSGAALFVGKVADPSSGAER